MLNSGARVSWLCAGFLAGVLFSLSWSASTFAGMAPDSGTRQTVRTATYLVTLEIGAVVRMEGMAAVPGMLSTDQGKPVNRHLAIFVRNRASGAMVMSILPSAKLTDEKSGTSRMLSIVRCTPPIDHGAGPHFGNNLFLPVGKYSFAVTLGNENAVFRSVLVKATGSGM